MQIIIEDMNGGDLFIFMELLMKRSSIEFKNKNEAEVIEDGKKNE